MTQYERIKADPEKYARHIARNMEWQRRNREKVREWQRRYQRKPEVAKKRNEKAKERYGSDPFYRARNAVYSARRRATGQGYIATRIRGAVHLIRRSEKGLYHRMFTAMSGKPGHYDGLDSDHVDHIIPLVKFDLTDPVQLLKAVHWTNVRGCTAEENMKKGDECGPFDMGSLEYCQTEDALYYAKYFIERCQKMIPNEAGPVLTREAYEQRRLAGTGGCSSGYVPQWKRALVGSEAGTEEVAAGEPCGEHGGVPAVSEAECVEGAGVPAELPVGVAGG